MTSLLKLHTLISGELMAMRAEIGTLALFMAELENVEETRKEKLISMAERNFKRFDHMEKIFENFKNAQDEQKQD